MICSASPGDIPAAEGRTPARAASVSAARRPPFAPPSAGGGVVCLQERRLIQQYDEVADGLRKNGWTVFVTRGLRLESGKVSGGAKIL
eukprot:5715772-Pyramimonas_sp.AAC.1